jgi:esterase/lipase
VGFYAGLFLPKFRLPQSKTRNGSKLRLDEYCKKDPHLYREGMWTSTLFSMLTMMYNFRKHFKNLKNPYLIVQSGNDKLIDPFLAIDLERNSASKDKTTVIIRDMWHNVWFDPRRNDVVRIIEEWL